MQDDDNKKVVTPTQDAQATFGLELDLTGSAPANIVPVAETGVAANQNSNNGTLNYGNATPEEKEVMDKIIKSIDLTNPDTILALGREERKRLGDLSDAILNSIQPEVSMAFASALKSLMDAISSNSISEMKKRLNSASSSFKDAVAGLNPFGPNKAEREKKKNQQMLSSFMTDISSSRKTIQEMVGKLETQQGTLAVNYGNINRMGAELVKTAQDMRVVRAAAAEKIRRLETGEDTTLSDLAAKAKASGRPDDMEKLNVAQANYNNLRKADAGLLGSVSVYEMNTANLAFTKQANLQNQLDTDMALSNTVNEWKGQLATFAMVTTETAAQTILNNVDAITAKSVQTNQDLFDTLVDMTVGRAASGPYNLRQLIEAQNHMAQKLSTVGERVDANFKALAEDKKALEANSKHFREAMVETFSQNGGNLLAGKAPAAPQP